MGPDDRLALDVALEVEGGLVTVAHSAGIVISRQLFGAGTAENVSALGSYRFQQSLETDGALQHPLIQQLP